MNIILAPADIVATRSSGWLGKAIRFFTRDRGEAPTEVNHVGMITVGGLIQDAIIVEALARVKRSKLIEAYGGKHAPKIAIFRGMNLTAEDRLAISAEMESCVGQHYGPVKLMGHLGDWVLGRILFRKRAPYVFRRLCRLPRTPICSWRFGKAFASRGYKFGINVPGLSPDDIWDFCLSNPDKYAVIIPLTQLDSYLGGQP